MKGQLQAGITSEMIFLDKSSGNKFFSEILEDYNGVGLKNFRRMEQKLENAFFAKFFICCKIHNIKKYFSRFI